MARRKVPEWVWWVSFLAAYLVLVDVVHRGWADLAHLGIFTCGVVFAKWRQYVKVLQKEQLRLFGVFDALGEWFDAPRRWSSYSREQVVKGLERTDAAVERFVDALPSKKSRVSDAYSAFATFCRESVWSENEADDVREERDWSPELRREYRRLRDDIFLQTL